MKHPYPTEKYGLMSVHVRKTKGWTQTELGDKLGVTRNTVYRLENGDRTPNHRTVQSLLNLFNEIWNEKLNQGINIRQSLDRGVMLGKARAANNIDLDPKTQTQLAESFRQDIKTPEGENFWITAGLIGSAYLALESLKK
jgi:transcriptional regulator with XRE-family HTH domain